MLTEFADRRPALSAVLIVLLFTAVPGAFLLIARQISGSVGSFTKIVFVYELVLQVILWFKVERPILNMLPFILSLLGLIVSEIVYTVSMSMAPIGAGPSPLAFVFSSVLVILFGLGGAASVGGLIAYVVMVIAKRLWAFIVCR